MKLLHIDSSILGEGSASRALTAAAVNRLTAAAGVELIHRDLAAAALPHATAATLPGDHPLSAMAGELDSAAQAVRAESQAILDEFLAADTIVIGVPMYNFGIPVAAQGVDRSHPRPRQDLRLRRQWSRGAGQRQADHPRHHPRRFLRRGHELCRRRACRKPSARDFRLHRRHRSRGDPGRGAAGGRRWQGGCNGDSA